MEGQLIQVLGDGIEELYWTDQLDKGHTIPFSEKVQGWWKEWESDESGDDTEEESFEEWMWRTHSFVTIKRVFVEEVYV